MWQRSFVVSILLISFAVFASACQSGEADHEEEQLKSSVDSTEVVSSQQLEEIHKERLEAQKNDLDSIQLVVETWNRSLNERNTELMELVYANKVQFYKKTLARSEIIAAKQRALDKTPSYKQSIRRLAINYPSNRPDIISCEFYKRWNDGNKTDSVLAILEIEFINGEYRIVKESDFVTELNLVRESPTRTLPEGTFTYMYDYWEDTREHELLAHDFVPYYMTVIVSRKGNKADVQLSWYSGALRWNTDFAVRRVSINDSYLNFEAAARMSPDDEEEDLDNYQHFSFRLLKSGEIALEENDGWFEEMRGVRLWEVK